MLYLSLRFSRHVTVRQLRSSKRIPWRAEYSRMSSVLLAPERPDITNDLRIMLEVYSQVALPATRILDVSEGAVCPHAGRTGDAPSPPMQPTCFFSSPAGNASYCASLFTFFAAGRFWQGP